jgi:hypothetical protein
MAQSDVLILLDCCSSGVGNASEGNGVTESIGACSFDREADGVGHYSFSQALATELRMLSKKPCFSVGELFQNIYTRIQYFMDQGLKNERYPTPVHLMLHDSGFGSSVPTTSFYAASVASFISKAGDADSNYFRAPPIPREAIDGKPFECFICGRIISHIKNRVDWKWVFHQLLLYLI